MKERFKITINPKEDLKTLLLMVIMSIIQGFVISIFYTPYKMISSGITGIALLVNYLSGFNSTILILLLNIPIVIIGFLTMDAKSTIFSTIGTFLFATAISITEKLSAPFIDSLRMDPILAVAFGGAILGITYAPVVKRNATFGGMDIISMLVNKKLSIPMGVFNIMYNIVIMAVQGIAMKNIELTVLAIAGMFVCNTAFDFAMKGLNRTNTVFIISDKCDEAAKDILTIVNRGLTYIPAEGAYTGTKKKIMYCIVRTVELSKLRNIVMKHDPHALFSVIETKEVVGRGFGAVN